MAPKAKLVRRQFCITTIVENYLWEALWFHIKLCSYVEVKSSSPSIYSPFLLFFILQPSIDSLPSPSLFTLPSNQIILCRDSLRLLNKGSSTSVANIRVFSYWTLHLNQLSLGELKIWNSWFRNSIFDFEGK